VQTVLLFESEHFHGDVRTVNFISKPKSCASWTHTKDSDGSKKLCSNCCWKTVRLILRWLKQISFIIFCVLLALFCFATVVSSTFVWILLMLANLMWLSRFSWLLCWCHFSRQPPLQHQHCRNKHATSSKHLSQADARTQVTVLTEHALFCACFDATANNFDSAWIHPKACWSIHKESRLVLQMQTVELFFVCILCDCRLSGHVFRETVHKKWITCTSGKTWRQHSTSHKSKSNHCCLNSECRHALNCTSLGSSLVTPPPFKAAQWQCQHCPLALNDPQRPGQVEWWFWCTN